MSIQQREMEEASMANAFAARSEREARRSGPTLCRSGNLEQPRDEEVAHLVVYLLGRHVILDLARHHHLAAPD